MKSLVRNHKCVVFVLLTLLIVLGANNISHAQQLLVSNMNQRSLFYIPTGSTLPRDYDPLTGDLIDIYPWVPLTAWTPLTQEFTTGEHVNGYEIDAIKFDVRATDSGEHPNLSVSIWSEDSFEGTLLYTLVGSKVIDRIWTEGGARNEKSTLQYTFVGSQENRIILAPDTSYYIEVKANDDNSARLLLTYENEEDDGSAPGWSIANRLADGRSNVDFNYAYGRGHDVTPERLIHRSRVLKIRIEGELRNSPTPFISLKNVGEGQFKATGTVSVPFDIVLPITVVNGTIDGGATTVTIPAGSTSSALVSVSRIPGTTFPVLVDIGDLPSPPTGYTLLKMLSDLPRAVLARIGGITPVSERTPQVRDAIVRAVPGVNSANSVTETHLAAITTLRVNHPAGTAVSNTPIQFQIGDFSGLTALTTLEMDYHGRIILPDGLFDDLTSLESISFYNSGLTTIPNAVLSLTSLKYLNLGYHVITSIPAGTFDQLTQLETLILDGVAYANTFTSLPAGVFDKLTSLTSLDLGQNNITSLPAGVFDKLTSLTSLDLGQNNITSLPAGVFDKLTSLTHLNLAGNNITSLPASIFSGMSLLTSLRLRYNAVDPLPLAVSLKKVADGQFKAVAPTGAPFDIVLPVSVTNGNIMGETTTVTISKGSVESDLLNVIRTAGTTAAVTVNIGTLPELPSGHNGYTLVKSSTRALPVINVGSAVTNYAPIFNDGVSTTRSVAENTVSSQHIGTTIAATDADNDTLTYTLGGTDAAAFIIDSTSGQLQTKAALDYETQTSYSVTITVSDGNGGTDSITVTINVTDIDEGVIDPLLSERTQQVQDAIVAAVAGVDSVDNVTSAHLAAITHLRLDKKSISSLKPGDFSGLISLRSLYLSYNSISDISALENLTALEWLSLDGNSIRDLSAFENLTTLKVLSLDGNSISDLSTLENLTALEWLYLRGNSINDISGLENLTALRRLDLSENYSISDISVLKNLIALRNLDLEQNFISDISALEGLISLEDLDLKNNLISDYAPLHKLKAANPDVNIDIDINNNPPVFSEGASTTRSIAENTPSWRNIMAPVSATDADNDTLVYLIRGTDAASFHVGIATGQLQNRVSLDYEIKNSYSVIIAVYDGNGGGNRIDVTINVTDVSETNNAPVFTGGTTDTRTITENTAANTNIGTAISATDADNDTLTYTLGGTDAAAFSIVSSSGQLQTKAALDYETKTSYSVTVSVSDGNGGSDSITVIINVTDVHEVPIIPVSERTPKVRDAIVATVPNVNDAADITAAHLAAITSLNLRNAGISALEAGDFSGMTGLTSINLFNNQLSSFPDGIFEGLTSLTTIRIGLNAVDPLPFIVSLEKVADGQFKAIAPAGALFNIVLPITVTNGSITDGATTLTIAHGSVESESLSVTRTAGTTADVTVDIGTLPSLPRTHYGYALVKSDTLPITIISGTNTAPVFTEGTSTTRSIAENTATGQPIGTAVAAIDAENDSLIYTVSGTDASAFDIDSTTGQLKTKAALDYETKSSYTVTVTVSDGNLTGTITVTINVPDIDEVVTPPITPDPPTANVAPKFSEGDSTTRIVLENASAGVNIGNPITATDANNDFLAYTLGGVDANAFDLDSSGQLKTKAALDYETKRVYTVTITVDDEELSDTITVIISVIDVNDTVISVGFVPVADRTPEVRDAIVAAIPNVTAAANVTEAQVAAITNLNLRSKGISSLKTGDFSGMTALTNLNLFRNNLSSLPSGIFDGLTALTTLRLGGNTVDPLPLIVSLQKIGDGQFKAVVTTGAPFRIVLPINVTNGSISGGSTSATIPQGSLESTTFTVSSTSGATTSPIVSIGTLPSLPEQHFGYSLALSNVCNRTKTVAEAIAKAVGLSDCNAVTEVDLAMITSLDLSGSSITALNAVDFDGMFSLKTLYLSNNDLTSLPNGIFEDLVSLSELFLNSNKLTTLPNGVFSNLTSLTNLYLQSNDLSSLPSNAFDGLSSLVSLTLTDNDLTSLPGGIFDGMSSLSSLLLSNNKLTSIPDDIFSGLTQLSQLHLSWNPTSTSQLSLTVTLQKVGTNQFKAVAPSGAPFAMTVPIKVTNGTLAGGVNAIIIPIGGVESRPITITRIAGTVKAVTADIGTPLPSRPATHNGYVLVKSTTLPLEVLPPLNLPPVFKDGANTVRAIAENTDAGTNIGDPVTATDQDTNDTLTYTLGGTDTAAFEVDSKTGQIKTKAALDFETKKSYTVTLTVSDGVATDTITVRINITDIDENRAPMFTEGATATRTVAENTIAGTNIGNAITATDPDNDTITYRLGGQDASAFGIDTGTGQLKTSAALDYETKVIYSVSVTVSDGKLTATIAVTINVTDVEELEKERQEVVEGPNNNAPVFTDGASTTRSVSDDSAIGVDIGAAVTATDADGHTLTYTLGGTDAAAFTIDSTTGQLRTSAALDYETKSSYTVTITASDGTDEETITVTINVVDATENRAPVFPVFIVGVNVSRSVAENTGSGVNIGTPISATDADGDTLTYTLGGTDASAFSIDSATGQLKTKAALDYETKSSYTVTVSVSDGKGGSNIISVTINVTDLNESAPTAGFTPVSERTPVIRDAIVRKAGVESADDVTEEHLAGITRLVIDGHSHTIPELKDGDFDGLTGLTDLEIAEGRFTSLPAGIFDDLTGLTTLTLEGWLIRSQLNSLPVGIFDNLTKLTTLNLEYTKLTSLPSDIFDGLTALTTLNLSNNKLSSLPNGIFDGLSALTTLSLSERNISSLPDGIFDDLSALTTLNLSNNKLSSLPNSIFDGLSALTTLSLSRNKLSSLPDGIFDGLSTLTTLNLSNNKLSSLPDDIFDGLSALTTLDLSGHNFSSLPADIFNGLAALTTLNLKGYYNLHEYIFGSSLSSLPAGVFNGLTALTTLDLSRNSLSSLPAGIFVGLTALTSLNIWFQSSGRPLTFTFLLEKIADGQFKVVIPTGAPSDILLPLAVTNGSINGDVTTVPISTGKVESNTLTVTRTPGTTGAVTVDIVTNKFGYTVNWSGWEGYYYEIPGSAWNLTPGIYLKSDIPPLEVIAAVANAPTSVDSNTPQIPEETALLTNFPNPFNPETWIPFQLTKPAQVTLTIYDIRGVVVRQLKLGHKASGVYTSRSRAIHWDGRNSIGEKAATGVYFYTLKAGDYTATRKMLIRK